MGETEVLDDAVMVYAKSKAANENAEVLEILADNFKQKICEEVENKAKDKIIKAAEKEKKVNEQKQQMKQLKWIIVETVIIGILVGLLANQGTDIINYLKGDKSIKVNDTVLWIIFLLVVNALFIFFIYLDKFKEIFNNED